MPVKKNSYLYLRVENGFKESLDLWAQEEHLPLPVLVRLVLFRALKDRRKLTTLVEPELPVIQAEDR